MARTKITRRQFHNMSAGAAALGFATNFFIPSKANAREAQLVFWLQPNFNAKADDLLVQQTMEYAKMQGLSESDVRIEKVPGGEVVPRMAAALEVGSPPDVTRVNEPNMVNWGPNGHLVDLTPVIEEMRTREGGINEDTLLMARINGEILGVPMGIAASAAHVRIDKFREAGYDKLPETWEEFIEAAKKINQPPFFAFGMALGLTPSDSLVDILSVVDAYGGSLVDAQNRPAFESDGTIEAFRLINAMYNEHRIIPRGAVSWDNASNNQAYQSGQIAYALNPTSIYSSLIADGNPLLDVTVLDIPPGGPAGRHGTISTDYYGVFKKSPNVELAMGLVAHFMKPENYDAFILEAGGRYLPSYPAQLQDPFWSENPAFDGLRAAARTGRSMFYPGNLTPALSEVVVRTMVQAEMQNVLVKGKDPAAAVADVQKQMVETFQRLGEPV
jgi:multiple sugar transport system substrate-binding protein